VLSLVRSDLVDVAVTLGVALVDQLALIFVGALVMSWST
jgi:hypothetical protein